MRENTKHVLLKAFLLDACLNIVFYDRITPVVSSNAPPTTRGDLLTLHPPTQPLTYPPPQVGDDSQHGGDSASHEAVEKLQKEVRSVFYVFILAHTTRDLRRARTNSMHNCEIIPQIIYGLISSHQQSRHPRSNLMCTPIYNQTGFLHFYIQYRSTKSQIPCIR